MKTKKDIVKDFRKVLEGYLKDDPDLEVLQKIFRMYDLSEPKFQYRINHVGECMVILKNIQKLEKKLDLLIKKGGYGG